MSDIKKILTKEEIFSFIAKGIENAKGSTEAIALLNKEDCLNLGKDIAKRELIFKKIFSKKVTIDPERQLMDVLSANNRKVLTNRKLIQDIPLAILAEVEIFFFHVPYEIVNDSALEKEYKLRELTPCNPIYLAKANEDDPEFATNYPNVTHWKNKKKKWCYCYFINTNTKPLKKVFLYQDTSSWEGNWWFAGLRT